MKRFSIFLALLAVFSCLPSQESQACTTFHFGQDRPVCGKNYDWMVEDGLVIINKQGVVKTAMTGGRQTAEPLRWTSKYGSATFNQYGRELPTGGMNEAGLIVETMSLPETRYPSPDSRPALSAGQWKQYLLDNFASVEEVIASDSRIRIRPSAGPGVHFMVCDKTGKSAVIEFIEGKFVCHAREDMPVKALTNSIYSESLNYWKENKLPAFDRYDSIGRFITAANMLKDHDSEATESNVDHAFDILESTRQPSTQWSIVYDVEGSLIYFKTAGNQKIRRFDMKKFDFSCRSPVKVLDITADLSGDVTDRFTDYTQEINRDLIGNAFRKTPTLNHIPKTRLDRLSRYPESTVCAR